MAITVTLRTAKRDYTVGVRTFYISSFTEEQTEYVLKVIRRPGRRCLTCTCPDFTHRRFPLRRNCKHLRLLRDFLRRVRGQSNVPNGVTLRVRGRA